MGNNTVLRQVIRREKGKVQNLNWLLFTLDLFFSQINLNQTNLAPFIPEGNSSPLSAIGQMITVENIHVPKDQDHH